MPALSIATAQTCVNLCIGVAALWSAPQWGLGEIKRALDCLKDANTLKSTVMSLGLDSVAAKLAKEAKAHADAMLGSAEFAPLAPDYLNRFEQVVGLCDFNAGFFVERRTQGTLIVTAWLDHIVDAAPTRLADYYRAPETSDRRFFTAVTTPVIDRLLREKDFQPVLEFDRWKQAFGQLDQLLSVANQTLAATVQTSNAFTSYFQSSTSNQYESALAEARQQGIAEAADLMTFVARTGFRVNQLWALHHTLERLSMSLDDLLTRLAQTESGKNVR